MFGLSLEHLLVIGIVILLFGARRLPELGGSMGKAFKNFKHSFETDPEALPHPKASPGDSQGDHVA